METIITEALKQGPAGLLIAYLLYQNYKQAKEYAELFRQFVGLQDKRVLEVAESVKLLGANSASCDALAKAVDKVADKLEDIEDELKER